MVCPLAFCRQPMKKTFVKVDEKVQPSLNETSSPLCNHPSNAHCKLKRFFGFVSLFAIQKVENRWLWMLWCMSWNSSHMYLWRVEKYLWTDSPPNLVDILHVFLFCTNFSTESKCTVRLPCLLKRQQGQNVGEKIKPKTLKCGQNRQKTKKAVGKPRGLYIKKTLCYK